MSTPQLDEFKEILRLLCIQVENAYIENMVYFDAIIESRNLSLVELKKKVESARLDPGKRKDAREAFSEMWKALEDSGKSAVFEDLLNSLPPAEKPN